MSPTELETKDIDRLIAELKHENYRVCYKAAYGLGELRATIAIRPLLESLGEFDGADEDSKVNQAAGDALAMIGEAAIMPLINALCKDESNPRDGWRRYWVADILGIIEDKRALEPLIKALEDENLEVVESAAGALGRIGDKRTLEFLLKALGRFIPSDVAVYSAISDAIESIRQHKEEV